MITTRAGKNITFYAADTILKPNTRNFILNSYLVGNFGILSEPKKIKNTLFFNGKKILIVDSTGIYVDKLQPDILILTQSPKINLDRILAHLHPKIIVADASNSYKIQKIWEASCAKKNIPFHATAEKGFYKLN